MKDFDKFIFKGAIKIKPVFPIRPNPKLCQIWKRDLYEIRLSLLCETMTFFNPNSGAAARTRNIQIKEGNVGVIFFT